MVHRLTRTNVATLANGIYSTKKDGKRKIKKIIKIINIKYKTNVFVENLILIESIFAPRTDFRQFSTSGAKN